MANKTVFLRALKKVEENKKSYEEKAQETKQHSARLAEMQKYVDLSEEKRKLLLDLILHGKSSDSDESLLDKGVIVYIELLDVIAQISADLTAHNIEHFVIRKYEYQSNFLGIPVDRTDDWCFETKNRVITKVMVGGTNCHHMYGISYWTEEDGAKLYDDIKKVYEMPGGKERYWDQVALDYCIESYDVRVRECSFSDIVEIDTFNELKQIDKNYAM